MTSYAQSVDMTDDLQRIAYCLSAAATFVADNQISHLIYANGGELTETVWEPASGETIKEEEVGSGVKDGAPAAYVWYSNIQGGEEYNVEEDEGFGGEERMVFSVTPENTFIAFKYDYEEDDIWKEYQAGNISTVTALHPQSDISAALTPDGFYLFFMNPSGKLQAIVRRGGEDWTLEGELPAAAKIGTPLLAEVSQHGIILFYFGVDDTLHYLRQGQQPGRWEDHRVDNIVVRTPVTRFRASAVNQDQEGQDEQNLNIEAYVLTDGRLWQLSQSNEPIDIGVVDEGILRKNNNAQNIRWISRGCRPYYYRVTYVIRYYHYNYYRPRPRGLCW
ncbi:hypothetical protein TWF481_003291 [Arthrobotrys musiformis]|uniref:Fucose-specific lectin n=1 Tax=Arthrobotrys musiformis TaxID=47236 RepID=A0AAV9VQ28_9PEZI